METKKRSLVKAIFYRIMHWFIHAFFYWLLIGEPLSSGLLAIVSNLVCFLSYYLYERLWNKIKWGYEK